MIPFRASPYSYVLGGVASTVESFSRLYILCSHCEQHVGANANHHALKKYSCQVTSITELCLKDLTGSCSNWIQPSSLATLPFDVPNKNAMCHPFVGVLPDTLPKMYPRAMHVPRTSAEA